MTSFTPLTADSVISYVKGSVLIGTVFQADDELIAHDIADGNANLVFRVSNCDRASRRSVIVKQALPHARRYPEFRMPLERAYLEREVNEIENAHCPGSVPAIYLHDADQYLNVFEDLRDHRIMRDGIMSQSIYDSCGAHLGYFLARTLFFTSDLYLSSAEKKARVARFTNPVLVKIQEDLCLTFPFTAHASNRIPSGLEEEVRALQANSQVQFGVLRLREQFLSHTQALIHGDFHTGSIMATPQDTRVIDPEFACYGPMGFDIGNVVGNLIMGHTAQEFFAADQHIRSAYRLWLRDTISSCWATFEAEFRRLWQEHAVVLWGNTAYQDDYISRLFNDMKGFAGCEIIRRTIGMAKIPELEAISDPHALQRISRSNLQVGIALLTQPDLHTIEQIVQILPR